LGTAHFTQASHTQFYQEHEIQKKVQLPVVTPKEKKKNNVPDIFPILHSNLNKEDFL